MCALIGVVQSEGRVCWHTMPLYINSRCNPVTSRRPLKSDETCTESGYAKGQRLYGSSSVISELSFMLNIKCNQKPSEVQNYKHSLEFRMVTDAKNVSGRQ